MSTRPSPRTPPRASPRNAAPLRSGLRQAAAPAPAPAVVEPQRPPPPAPTPLREFGVALIQVCCVAAVLVVLLFAMHLMSDSVVAASHLAKAKAEKTDLVCQDGRMNHGDNSLHDRVFEKSVFVCTDWRTQQALELEKPKR